MCLRFLLQRGASLSAVNCDGDVPLDIALDETTESLLQEYTLKQGKVAAFLETALCLSKPTQT